MQAGWRTASREELIAELERQERENARLRRELERERDRHRHERERLRKKIDRLEDDLHDARRALHRQAAPFSRGMPRRQPRRLTITPGGLVHVIRRAARRTELAYDALRERIRGSPVVTFDETSWKVDARLQWLWAAATPDTTVYAIQQDRGFAEATTLLGADFAGVVVRDGWAPYRRFEKAVHQSCLAHLLRRCRTLILDHRDRRLAPRVRRILQQALRVRDRYYAGRVSARFAAHLAVEFPAVFTFLLEPHAIDATNWRAGQALRPAVVTRKARGGNRSERGAEAHAVLAPSSAQP